MVSPELQHSVMPDVFTALCTDMMPTVDLDDEAAADQSVDTVTCDPDLSAHGHPEPAEPLAEVRLQSRIREGRGGRQNSTSGWSPGKAPQVLDLHKRSVQCGLPRGERLLKRFALGDVRQHVLYRIDQRLRVTRDDRCPPVHFGSEVAPTRRVCPDGDVRDTVRVMHPEPEAAGLSPTGEYHPVSGCAQQERVGRGRGEPSTARAGDGPGSECSIHCRPTEPEISDASGSHDTTEVDDSLRESLCCSPHPSSVKLMTLTLRARKRHPCTTVCSRGGWRKSRARSSPGNSRSPRPRSLRAAARSAEGRGNCESRAVGGPWKTAEACDSGANLRGRGRGRGRVCVRP